MCIDPRVPVTFLCGSRSTISSEPFFEVQQHLSQTGNNYVQVEVSAA